MFRRTGAWMTFLMLGLAIAAHQLGWVDGLLLARAVAGLGLLLALLGVVSLPWDLTFQARNALAQQRRSKRRGIDVDEAEMDFAKKSASRALLLALSLHVVGAGLAYAARSILGDELGVILAAAFLGSMALRPIHAFYLHTKRRLHMAERDAAVPPPDATTLARADDELRGAIESMQEALDSHRGATESQLAQMEERTSVEANSWRRSAAAMDEKLDRVLREFERTIERTQQNGEVLAGIRAFVKLVREA